MKGLLIALGFAPTLACSQSAFPISTDRPSFSDGNLVVPPGHPQIEAGVTITTVQGSASTTCGELLGRIALSKRLELRLSNVTWTHVHGVGDGFQDPSIGLKFRLQDGSLKRLDLAGEIQSTVPVGGTNFRVERPQPTAKLLWYQQVNSADQVGGNFVVSDLGGSGARFTQWAESLYLSHTVNSKASLFAEVFRIDPISLGASASDFYDAGVTYLLSQRTQVDARLGAGFNPHRDGQWAGAGVAYRF